MPQQNIAILGNGTLSKSFQVITKHKFKIYARPIINFLNFDTLLSNLEELRTYDIILNTIGINNAGFEETMKVNFLAPCFLIENLIRVNYLGKVINIGSHASTWTSWPNISNERFIYNISKLNLRNYIIGLSQSNLFSGSLTLLDFTKFKSQMSNNEGYDPNDMANLIEQVIDSKSKILHLELY